MAHEIDFDRFRIKVSRDAEAIKDAVLAMHDSVQTDHFNELIKVTNEIIANSNVLCALSAGKEGEFFNAINMRVDTINNGGEYER